VGNVKPEFLMGTNVLAIKYKSCYPAFACLVLSAALSAASFLAIDRCRLSNLPSGTLPAMTSTIVSIASCRRSNSEPSPLLSWCSSFLIRRHRTDGRRPSKKGNRPVLVRWFWRPDCKRSARSAPTRGLRPSGSIMARAALSLWSRSCSAGSRTAARGRSLSAPAADGRRNCGCWRGGLPVGIACAQRECSIVATCARTSVSARP
jgi:hypothetical protein